MEQLSMSVLGTVKINIDCESATGFDSSKVRALLLYLAVEAHRVHSRESLATMFWPGFDNRKALSNLRYALANLRKTIGDRTAHPPYLLVTPRTLQFNTDSDYTLDLLEFEAKIDSGDIVQIQQATDLYGGAFLEGFAIPDSIAFEEWLRQKREQIQRKMLIGLKNIADHNERIGDYQDALKFATRQITIDSFLETAHRQLMRIYASTNQRTKALEQFTICSDTLMDELGVDPDEETISLYRKIRDEEFVPAPVSPSFLYWANGTQSIAPVSGFVGREVELAQLTEFADHMQTGQGQVAFICGSAGSGKSLLLQAFTRQVMQQNRNVIVVSGRCNAQSGISDPYLPFIEIMSLCAGDVEMRLAGDSITHEHARRLWAIMPQFTDSLLNHGKALIDRFLDGKALLERTRIGAPLFVEGLEATLKEQSGFSPAFQQNDLFLQYTAFLQALAGQFPLILMIDDFHWADTGSCSLLFHLGRRLVGHRILVIATYRPEHILPESPQKQLIHEFQQQNGDVFVDLSQSDGCKFVNAVIDARSNHLGTEFRSKIYQHTAGHTLFTCELIDNLQQRGDILEDENGAWVAKSDLDWSLIPPRTGGLIAGRMSRLSEQQQTILAVAAVEGDQFTDQVIAGVSGIPPADILRELSGALSKQEQLVLAESVEYVNGQGLSHYRFRHILFQNYLYNEMDTVQRGHLHAGVGQVLESLYGDDVPHLAGRIAYHFREANHKEKAIHYLYKAGNYAVSLFANREALGYYRQALDLLATLPSSDENNALALEIRLAMGSPLLGTEGFGSAELVENYRLARRLSQKLGNPMNHFQVLSGLKSFFDMRLGLSTALDLGEEMLEISQTLDDPIRRCVAHHHLTATYLYLGNIKACLEHRAITRELYQSNDYRDYVWRYGFDPEIAGLAHESWAYWHKGHYRTAIEISDRSLELADELAHPFMKGMAYFFAAQLAEFLLDRDRAHRLAIIASEISHQLGLTFWAVFADTIVRQSTLSQDEAWSLDYIEQTIGILRGIGANLALLGFTPFMATAASELGAYEFSLSLVEECIELAKRESYLMGLSNLQVTHGDLLRMKQDPEAILQARKIYRQAIQSAHEMGSYTIKLRATTHLSQLWLEQGDKNKAFTLLDDIYRASPTQDDSVERQIAWNLLSALSENISHQPSV